MTDLTTIASSEEELTEWFDMDNDIYDQFKPTSPRDFVAMSILVQFAPDVYSLIDYAGHDFICFLPHPDDLVGKITYEQAAQLRACGVHIGEYGTLQKYV